jgi:hypothetical protein
LASPQARTKRNHGTNNSDARRDDVSQIGDPHTSPFVPSFTFDE